MSLHLLHIFLVIFALAILIFIVTILTLAHSNNFVCIFLCLQRASLVGFFIFLFLILLFFFDLVFFYLSFFVFSVLAFTSFLGSFPFSFFPSFFCCSLFLSRTSLCFISVYSSHTLVYYLCDCNNKSLLFYLPCTFVIVTLVFCIVWGGVVLTLLVPYCGCVVDR